MFSLAEFGGLYFTFFLITQSHDTPIEDSRKPNSFGFFEKSLLIASLKLLPNEEVFLNLHKPIVFFIRVYSDVGVGGRSLDCGCHMFP